MHRTLKGVVASLEIDRSGREGERKRVAAVRESVGQTSSQDCLRQS